jgi:hypothetical protein
VATGGENHNTITWIPSQEQGSISYTVWKSTTSGGAYTQVSNCIDVPQPALPLPATISCADIDVSVLSDAPVYYYVVATADATSITDSNGSAPSLEVSAQAIASFSIAAVEVRGLANSLTISWPNTIGARTYEVKYNEGGGPFTTIQTIVQSQAGAIVGVTGSNLVGGTTYSFIVTALNTVGAGASVPTAASLGIPLGAFTFTFTPYSGYGNATLTRGTSGAAATYEIKYHKNTSQATTIPYPAISYTDSFGSFSASPLSLSYATLPENDVYYGRVVATNG